MQTAKNNLLFYLGEIIWARLFIIFEAQVHLSYLPSFYSLGSALLLHENIRNLRCEFRNERHWHSLTSKAISQSSNHPWWVHTLWLMKYLNNTMSIYAGLSDWKQRAGRTKIPCIFDARVAFSTPVWYSCAVALFAIDKVRYEWNSAKILCCGDSEMALETVTSGCTCVRIVTRYALPCQHRLCLWWAENRPIPSITFAPSMVNSWTI